MAAVHLDCAGGVGPQSNRNNNLLLHSSGETDVPVSIGVQLILQPEVKNLTEQAMFDVAGDDLFVFDNDKGRVNVYNVGVKHGAFATMKESKEVFVSRKMPVNLGFKPTVQAFRALDHTPALLYVTFNPSSRSTFNYANIDAVNGVLTQKLSLPPTLDLPYMSIDQTTGHFLMPNRRTGAVFVYNPSSGDLVCTVDVRTLLNDTISSVTNLYSPFAAFMYKSTDPMLYVVYGTGVSETFQPTHISQVSGKDALEMELGDLGTNDVFNCSDGSRLLGSFHYEVPSVLRSGATRDTHVFTLIGADMDPIASACLLSTRCLRDDTMVPMRVDRTTGRVFVNDRGTFLAFRIPAW